MKPTGRGKRRILFVGEAPGEEEDRRGVQLIGKAGQTLRKVLQELNTDLDDCWKTNAVCCRPPKNEIKDEYIEACRPTLLKVVQELKPSVIVLLGISAVKSLIGVEWGKDIGKMGKWVGWTIPSTLHQAWLCPTYHPSYVARMNEDPLLVRIVKDHLKKALSLEHTPPPYLSVSDLEKRIELVTAGGDARMRLLELVRKEGVLAFDYETTGLKPEHEKHRIVSCSFCLGGKDTWACMMSADLLPLLSRILLNAELGKVASNLKFEERWTRTKLGHGVANWNWDTMLAAHVLDNRGGISSVKFQAYVRLGVPDYDRAIHPLLEAKDANGFNRIDQISQKDLLLYNALDSLLEFRVMQKQKEEMGV